MYTYLSKAIKKRLIEALRYSFDRNPRHRDILPFIREKYSFSERPQKGIVFQGASANPLSLSSNNFLGTMLSHVMLARISGRTGACLDWVREDSRAVIDNEGVFPAEPGVYYIEVEEYTTGDGLQEFQFYVDPLLTVREEPVIEFFSGLETSAILANSPVVPGSVDLYLYPNELLFRGRGIRLTADESLYIDDSADTHLSLGLEAGWVAPEVTTVSGPFTIVGGTNDVLSLSVNGTSVSATLSAGNILASDVESALRAALIAGGVSYTDYTLTLTGNALRISASQSLEIANDLVSTASPTLGLSEGFVKPTIEGLMVQPYVPDRSTFRAVVDGLDLEVELSGGHFDVPTIALELSSEFAGTSLLVEDVPAGDYDLDPNTGDITFLHAFPVGTQIIADYRYPQPSLGPFPIGTGECSNNEVIPGVVLAFGSQLEDGDAMAVVVENDRTEVADIFGGKIDMSLDIDIFARDSMTRAELSDSTVMYLWQGRREHLAEEGIILQTVGQGGESEEPYDDTADDYYYLSSVNVSLLTDWEIHVEKPLYIRRITPTTFEEDAQTAATNIGYGDALKPTTDANLDDYRFVLIDAKGNWEVIR